MMTLNDLIKTAAPVPAKPQFNSLEEYLASLPPEVQAKTRAMVGQPVRDNPASTVKVTPTAPVVPVPAAPSDPAPRALTAWEQMSPEERQKIRDAENAKYAGPQNFYKGKAFGDQAMANAAGNAIAARANARNARTQEFVNADAQYKGSEGYGQYQARMQDDLTAPNQIVNIFNGIIQKNGIPTAEQWGVIDKKMYDRYGDTYLPIRDKIAQTINSGYQQRIAIKNGITQDLQKLQQQSGGNVNENELQAFQLAMEQKYHLPQGGFKGAIDFQGQLVPAFNPHAQQEQAQQAQQVASQPVQQQPVPQQPAPQPQTQQQSQEPVQLPATTQSAPVTTTGQTTEPVTTQAEVVDDGQEEPPQAQNNNPWYQSAMNWIKQNPQLSAGLAALLTSGLVYGAGSGRKKRNPTLDALLALLAGGGMYFGVNHVLKGQQQPAQQNPTP